MTRYERGALLFEAMIALAIMAMASLTLGSIVLQSLGSMDRTRRQMQACDLARSAMAMIEAGIADPTALHGPATRWDESRFLETDSFENAEVFDEFVPPSSVRATGAAGSGLSEMQWMLDIDTEPHAGTGLWLITITARLVSDSTLGGVDEASFTLRQLVRLGSSPEDVAGEEDDLIDAARRGADRPGGAR